LSASAASFSFHNSFLVLSIIAPPWRKPIMIDSRNVCTYYVNMPLIASRWLHPEKHTGREYAGEQEADELIDWLNTMRDKESGKRTIGLLDDISAVYKFADSTGLPLKQIRRTDLDEELQSLLQPVNKRLSRYKFWAQFEGRITANTLPVLWRSDHRDDEYEPGLLLTEHDAVRSLVELAMSGFLRQVRRCLHCNSWFYAKSPQNKFCQTKCQQSHYRMNPEWKASRRVWLRHYRRVAALPNVIVKEIKRKPKKGLRQQEDGE
jgi:hypothetical protein